MTLDRFPNFLGPGLPVGKIGKSRPEDEKKRAWCGTSFQETVLPVSVAPRAAGPVSVAVDVGFPETLWFLCKRAPGRRFSVVGGSWVSSRDCAWESSFR